MRVILCACLLVLSIVATPLFAQQMPALVAAAKQQDWSTLHSLLAESAEPNSAYGDGTTALHWASYHQHVKSVNELISHGGDVNASTDLGVTPLWLVAENGSEEIANSLLLAGADPLARLNSGESLVMTAARTGHDLVLALLLDAGASTLGTVNRDQTALMWAANQGHAAAVAQLLSHGADVNARSAQRSQFVKTEKPQDSPPFYKGWVEQGGNTALMFAARSGALEAAKLLIAADSDVNALSAFGTSPAIMAVHGGNAQLLALLLEHGANIEDASSGYTALHAAVLRGDGAAVAVLLSHGANTEALLESPTPARRQSADYHFHQALMGATPVWLAARFAEPEIMQQLLTAGANAQLLKTVSYPAQRTAAQLTAAQRRAGGSAVDNSIQAEDYMAEEGQISLLMASVGMGHRRLRVGWGNADRRAGILGAREEFILAASKLAVAVGVDLNLRNQSGQSALDFAKARRYASVVSYLESVGAAAN